MEKSGCRHAIRVQQKGDPGNNHSGSVRGVAGGRHGVVADFRRSNSALRTYRTWLDACRAGGGPFRVGAARGPPAADETGWQNFTLVRNWFWCCDDSFRLVENLLAVAWPAVFFWRVRYGKRVFPGFVWPAVFYWSVR